MKMKFLVNVFLIIVVLAVILPKTYQQSINETQFSQYLPKGQVHPAYIIVTQTIKCPEGQRMDSHGTCRVPV